MITEITLQNFRCYSLKKFPLEKITYICGENGCGKTSILEAVSMLNGQNSFRGANEELTNCEGGKFYEVMAETEFGRVCVKFDGEKKNLELDGDKAGQSSLKKLF